MHDTLFWWKVRGIDTRTRKLFDRYFVFDPPSDLPDEALRDAREVMDHKRRRNELVKLRPMFREVEMDQLDQVMRGSRGSSCVSPSANYFEDEAGNPLDEIDLIRIRTGQRDPIILGNVKSVLRLPHASIKDPSSWTLEKSNDVTHLLQLIGILQRTAWYRASLSLSSQGNDWSLTCPSLQETLPIFALLRQFLFREREKYDRLDDVFRRAVDHYAQHCSDQGKAVWILHEKRAFEDFVLGHQRLDFGCDLDGMSNGDVLDTLIYGTGIIHRRSSQNREDQLAQLQARNDRRKLAFVLHYLCRELLNSMVSAAILLQSDFAHWVNEGACPRPTRVVIDSILAPERAD